jgi:HK97 gp10 family phage protein
MSLKIKGDIRRFLKNANSQMLDKIDTAIVGGSMLLSARAKKNISTGSRSGRKYKRGKSGVIGTRSAPKQFPKTDTGSLVRSISHDRVSQGVAIVGSAVKHGEYLEQGTSKMKPRPWLQPSFDQVESKIGGMVKKAVKESFNESK